MQIFYCLCLVTLVSCASAAPDKTKLETGTTYSESQPFVEEVIVESVLQVRAPTTSRQARTNTRTSLQDGARVSETKNN